MLRVMAQMSHADVASRMGVTETTERRWEDARVQIPDGQKNALAQMFKVSVPFLMGWPETYANGNDA